MHPSTQSLHDVFIGVGSNLGRRITHLDTAVQSLSALGICQCSAVYETAPVGYADQPDFLNMVVHLHTRLAPRALLTALHRVEEQAQRVRDIRFGPRTLDLDILLYDDTYACFADLQIPHPRMWERAFVLVPLAEFVPHRKGLGGKVIGTLAREISQKEEVHYVGRFW